LAGRGGARQGKELPMRTKAELRIEVEKIGMKWDTYRARIKRGWDHDRAVNTPIGEWTSRPRDEVKSEPEPAAIFARLKL